MNETTKRIDQTEQEYLADAESRFQQETKPYLAAKSGSSVEEIMLKIEDKPKPTDSRRGRIAKAFVLTSIGAALIQANGGPEQIANGVRTLPAHIEYIYNGPEADQK